MIRKWLLAAGLVLSALTAHAQDVGSPASIVRDGVLTPNNIPIASGPNKIRDSGFTPVNTAGNLTFSANGAASTPALTFSGTPFTGGSTTTTKPLVLIETAGATSNAWDVDGTMFAVNAASGFNGLLIDGQVDGVRHVGYDVATAQFVAGWASGGFGGAIRGTGMAIRSNGSLAWATSGSATNSTDTALVRDSANVVGSAGTFRIANATAIPAGGTASLGYKFSSTTDFGAFFGSGAPTLAAAQGSLYLRSDGLPYYNTNGTTGWASLAPLVSPSFTTPSLGVATATSLNGLTVTSSTGTLTVANGKTLTASNTLTVTATDGSTLAVGTGGTLATAAYKSTGTSGNTVPLLDGANTWSATQTFSGAVLPTPFTLGATSVTATGTQLNYLAAATGTTGTTSTNVVYSGGPTLTGPIIATSTFASLPAAGSSTGRIYWVTDVGANGCQMRSNGTRYKVVGTCLLVSQDSESSSTTNTTPGIKLQTLLPAGALQAGDRLKIYWTQRKSGTTDQGGMTIYVGTAGTTSDTSVFGQNVLTAAQQQGGYHMDLRLVTNTTLGTLPVNNATGVSSSYPTINNSAGGAATTISDASSNALYVSMGVSTSGASNSSTMYDGQIYLVSSAN